MSRAINLNEKVIFKCQLYAERAWNLSTLLTKEALGLGLIGRGFGVVADETRALADGLSRSVEQLKFGDMDDECKSIFQQETLELTKELSLLALNCSLEIIRVCQYQSTKDSIIQVYCDDIRSIAISLAELFGNDSIGNLMVTPEITAPSKITDMRINLMQFTIGGIRFVENTRYVFEVLNCLQIVEGFGVLRGCKYPIIDCYKKLGLPQPSTSDYIRINIDWHKPDTTFIVAIDPFCANTLFRSQIGAASKTIKNISFKDYIRESWDSADGEQFLFMDWNELACKLA